MLVSGKREDHMPLMPLIVISVLFGLSLLAAWVLFKLLQSTATVNKPEYQLGGAAAGFVVILTLLIFGYSQLENKSVQANITKLTAELADAKAEADQGRACQAEQSAEVIFAGTVTPALQDAIVVLGVNEVQLQQNGQFAIKAQHVKPKDLPYIYVIGPGSHAPYKQVFATDDPGNLTIQH
jgi:hypothetical protein